MKYACRVEIATSIMPAETDIQFVTVTSKEIDALLGEFKRLTGKGAATLKDGR